MKGEHTMFLAKTICRHCMKLVHSAPGVCQLCGGALDTQVRHIPETPNPQPVLRMSYTIRIQPERALTSV